MDRKAQIEGLKETVILVLEVLAALLVIALVVWAGMIFFSKPVSTAEKDFARAFAELTTLPDGARILVPIQGSPYILQLYPPDSPEKLCKGKPCLCLEQNQLATLCKEMPDAIVKASAGGKCQGVCVADHTTAVVRTPVGMPVCRKGNRLLIGDAC